MGTDALRGRATWQDYSGNNAAKAEHSFFDTMNEHFAGTSISVDGKPTEFKKIYVDQPLSDEVLEEIYTPDQAIKYHGITPDYAIRNSALGKTLYVEVKRQDGWVEGKPRSAGRGNAHERSCKYFTPGLLNVLRKKAKIDPPNLPFWTVFIGDITRDPCRVREISLWYSGYESHFFMWRDMSDPAPLIRHFETKLKQLII